MKNKVLQLVIFGISGDLAKRKLLPAIYELISENFLPENLQIIGISRRELGSQDIFDAAEQFFSAPFDEAAFTRLKNASTILKMDPSIPAEYEVLQKHLATHTNPDFATQRLYYLSVPAQTFPNIVQGLGASNLNQAPNPNSPQPHILVEKPFGHNSASARELIDVTNQYFNENQVYRIDHYLAKETAQNLMVFRFDNPLFDAVWNSQHIAKIHIRASEQLDIQNRADFYEQTGALKDVVQSHLLQLLALITMERPQEFNKSEIHRAKLRALKAVQPAESTQTLRAQYEGYRQEVQRPDSNTETFVRLSLKIDNNQWRDTEIILEAGKALASYGTQIEVVFRSSTSAPRPNSLIFHLQPHEGVSLELLSKKPGLGTTTKPVSMNYNFKSAFPERLNEAYERVIADAVRGDQTLFASADEVMASWRILDPLIDAWIKGTPATAEAKGALGLKFYPKGAKLENIK